MSSTLMSDIQNGNLQMFSSKYQEQKFCLFKMHPKGKSRVVYSFSSSYMIMNQNLVRKICDIMSTKTYTFLFSRMLNLIALINCDSQPIRKYFYEPKTFVY